MNSDWQTWAVYAVVFCTAVLMTYFGFIKKTKHCGCGTGHHHHLKRKQR